MCFRPKRIRFKQALTALQGTFVNTFVFTAMLALLAYLPAAYASNDVSASSPHTLTPAEHTKLQAWVLAQANAQPEEGYLFNCKGADGKFFKTRVLGPNCVVYEQLGPFVVLSDTPGSGWRKVQSTSAVDYYLDDSSFSYLDEQVTPKAGAGATAWFKVVYHQPQRVAHSKNNEMFTTLVTSLNQDCKHNTVNYGISWLYSADGKLVDAYPPSPSLIVQPQNPMATVLSAYCKGATVR